MIGAGAMVFLMAQGNLDLSTMANLAVSCVLAVKAAQVNPLLAIQSVSAWEPVLAR